MRKQKFFNWKAMRKIFLTVCALICTLSLFAQGSVTVTGTVTDSNGELLPGANIIIKGTQTGVVSDVNGKYSITVPDKESVLVFSFVSFTSQEVKVGKLSTIHISLSENNREIEEVVVVGYGTQKKINLTGAVSTVSGAELLKRPLSNPLTALQGRVSGLSIVQTTGQPGSESVSMRIRGQGTYSSAGSDPLVLVDGVPGNLNTLNANDIESISVLKDASSASIYGARAANGVILVTTKTGQENHTKIAYHGNWGIHTPTHLPKLVNNSADYMRLYNEAIGNSGIANSSNLYSDEMIAAYETATDRAQYPNFDWFDYAFNPAVVQNHDFSISGGNKGTTYNVSLGYIDQPGTMRGFGYEKYNMRANLVSQVKEWAKMGANIFLERGDVEATSNGQGDAMWAWWAQAPTYSPILPDGSGYTYMAYPFETRNRNMAAIIDNGSMTNAVNYEVRPQMWLELKLLKELTWYTKGAVSLSEYHSKSWRPVVPLYWFHSGEPAGNLDVGTQGLSVDNSKTWYTNLFSYLKYEKDITSDHHIGVQAGYSQEINHYEALGGYRRDFLAPLTELNAGEPEDQTNYGYSNEWALMSLFGRLNYNYKGRYLLEANVRYDGTSRISKANRWGYFPSVSGGWRITEENFMKEFSSSWLNNLKIRGSYGLLGNQNIGLYPYQANMVFTGNYSYDNSKLSAGLAQMDYANQYIKWESTSVFDIGADITVFKGLSLTYDYYKKHTFDILRSAQTSAALGLNSPTINDGEMINYGHEVSVQYHDRINNGSFNGLEYGGGINFNKYRNETAGFGAEELGSFNIRRNGEPYNSYYLIQCIGIFQNTDEIRDSPKQFTDNTKPGDIKFRDANGDGVIDNDDRVIIPGKFPNFEYSFNLYAAWKGFDITAFFQGVEGGKVYINGDGYLNPFTQGTRPVVDWLTERWTGEGTSNTFPKIYYRDSGNSQNTRPSDRYLMNTSYFRLKNLTVGYTVPKKITSRIQCERLRFYFSGDNLLTFAPLKNAFDPELASDGGTIAQYPQNKIISFGINLEF
jgi:TonB-linked SusC/RagA family outer membrane protein